jgi:anti-sigma B factor antagonist
VDTEDNKMHIEIKGELSIYTVAALRQQLLDALDGAQEVEVDLSDVGEMDSAGMQLMVAAKREAALRDKALRFSGHSPAVFDVLELCKLSGHLGDPLLIRSKI